MKLERLDLVGLIMKRKSNLYESMLYFGCVDKIFNKIKNNYKNKKNLYRFVRFKNCYFVNILDRLRDNCYKFGEYGIFLIKDPKYRIIMSENIPDKIVNHMVSKYILLPSIDKCLIDTNVATRIGRGSGYAFEYFRKYVQRIGCDREIYVLKVDISKYFYNIDHGVLKGLLRKKIKDKQALKIIDDIIDTTNLEYINKCIDNLINQEKIRISKLKISKGEKERKYLELSKLPRYGVGKGLPIGNMTSQLMAIFYLNEVDHFIKEVLKHKYYIRYMDDLLILDTDKEKLLDSFAKIREMVEKYKLVVNDKSNLYRLSVGINFLGYSFRLRNSKLMIRYSNQTIRRVNRQLKRNKRCDYELYLRSKNSYKGYFMKCNTKLYINKYKPLEKITLYSEYEEMKEFYKDELVFMKRHYCFYTYDDRLYQILGYNREKVIVFNRKKMEMIRKMLDVNNIRYVIRLGNDINEYNKEGEYINMTSEKAIVFRKNGNFYRSFDEDAVMMSYLFDYKLTNASIGFPLSGLSKVSKTLREKGINFIVKDKFQVVTSEEFVVNNYSTYMDESMKMFKMRKNIERMNEKMKSLSEMDILDLEDYIDKLLKAPKKKKKSGKATV